VPRADIAAPKRILNVGSRNSSDPLSPTESREILWDIYVVCLNAHVRLRMTVLCHSRF
jgi:hypothetical protein